MHDKMSNLPERLFLCGFMGSGKSTIGRNLAVELGLSFVDLDVEIEKQAGLSIPELFKNRGEHSFRKIERKFVHKSLSMKNCVIALGGGALQYQYLIDRIKDKGLLIFIDCPLSVILPRIKGDKNRPLLLGDNSKEKNPKTLKDDLQNLYEERLPFYRQAEIQIDSSVFSSIEEIVDYLSKKIKKYAVSD